ncbi:hypothetical protein ACQP3L_38485, partial [Escherichia coli]
LISAAKTYIFREMFEHRYPERVDNGSSRRQRFLMKISVSGMGFIPSSYWLGSPRGPYKCYLFKPDNAS